MFDAAGIRVSVEESELHHSSDSYAEKDDRRNEKFAERVWVVVRFTEREIRSYLDRCAAEVVELISALRSEDTAAAARISLKAER